MKYAIVSDIHANLQAWDAILKDARLVGAETILCLGDIVGYGPRPAEVLESVCSNAGAMILGDHEAVVAGRLESSTFGEEAQEIVAWTGSRLSSVASRLFGELDHYLQGDGFIICHAQADEPELFKYIRTPEDARASLESYAVPLVFAGHTHEPGVFVLEESTGEMAQAPSVEFLMEPGKRYFVNVGSVGDPVHGQLLGSYGLYDSDTGHITFRFVPFDVAGFRRDVEETSLPALPHFLRPKQQQRGTGKQEALAIQVPLMNPNRRSGPIRYVSASELQDTSRTIRMKSYDSPILRRRQGLTESSRVPADDLARSTGGSVEAAVDESSAIVVPPAASPSGVIAELPAVEEEVAVPEISPEAPEEAAPPVPEPPQEPVPEESAELEPAAVDEPPVAPMPAPEPEEEPAAPTPSKKRIVVSAAAMKRRSTQAEPPQAEVPEAPAQEEPASPAPAEEPVAAKPKKERRGIFGFGGKKAKKAKKEPPESPPPKPSEPQPDGEGAAKPGPAPAKKTVRTRKVVRPAKKKTSPDVARKRAREAAIKKKLHERQQAALAKRKAAEASEQSDGETAEDER